MTADSGKAIGMPWHRFGTQLTDVSTARDAALAAGSSNIHVLSFFDPIVETGAVFYESAGSNEKSKENWILARLKGELEIAPGDSIGMFLLLAHKAGSPRVPTISCKPVRLVNATTLHDGLLYPLTRVAWDGKAATEHAHLEEPPDLVVKKVRLHLSQLADQFMLMTRVEMDRERLDAYFERVFPNPDPAKSHQRLRERFARIVAERPLAIAECTRLFVEGNGNSVGGVSGSLWAAYGAVAEYVDYWKVANDDPDRLAQVLASPLKAYAMANAGRILRSR